jgi:HlyD family secretion protein
MIRFVKIVAIVSIVVGASATGWFFLAPKPYDIAQDPSVEVVEIGRDTMVSTVNATGRIEPASEIDVVFGASGSVAEVLVRRGQAVTKGTLMARLHTDDLELAIKRAESELARAKAQLGQLYEPPLEADVASARAEVARAKAQLDELYRPASDKELESAQAAVTSARANLNKVVQGLDENEVTVRAAELRRADIALKQAQWAYDQVAYRGDIGAMPQAAELEQATLDYETARANFLIATKGADEADIAAAEAQVAQAESALDQLVRGPTEAEAVAARAQVAQAEASLARLLKQPNPTDVAIARAAVNGAQAALDQAKVSLTSALLVAPVDGVVTEVNVRVGESTAAGRVLGFTLTDLSAFHIDVDIDEIDIGRIKRGQVATTAIDAIPDTRFLGHVSDIAAQPAAESTSGIVSYRVTIALDTHDAPLLTGMTTDATIETDRLENALVIPNRAVSIDRTSGEPKYTVEKIDAQGLPTRTEITLGLRNDTVSEVLTGLAEGDRVVIGQESRREQLQRVFQGGD